MSETEEKLAWGRMVRKAKSTDRDLAKEYKFDDSYLRTTPPSDVSPLDAYAAAQAAEFLAKSYKDSAAYQSDLERGLA